MNDPAVEGMLIENPAGMGGLGWGKNSSPVRPIGTRCMKNNKEWTSETQRDRDTLVYHNKGCFVKAVERSNGHDAKSLPNDSFYQSLNRDKMIYQPLRKNEVPKVNAFLEGQWKISPFLPVKSQNPGPVTLLNYFSFRTCR